MTASNTETQNPNTNPAEGDGSFTYSPAEEGSNLMPSQPTQGEVPGNVIKSEVYDPSLNNGDVNIQEATSLSEENPDNVIYVDFKRGERTQPSPEPQSRWGHLQEYLKVKYDALRDRAVAISQDPGIRKETAKLSKETRKAVKKVSFDVGRAAVKGLVKGGPAAGGEAAVLKFGESAPKQAGKLAVEAEKRLERMAVRAGL